MEIQHSDRYREKLCQLLGRDVQDDDIFKTQIDGEILFCTFAEFSEEEMERRFPIQIKVDRRKRTPSFSLIADYDASANPCFVESDDRVRDWGFSVKSGFGWETQKDETPYLTPRSLSELPAQSPRSLPEVSPRSSPEEPSQPILASAPPLPPPVEPPPLDLAKERSRFIPLSTPPLPPPPHQPPSRLLSAPSLPPPAEAPAAEPSESADSDEVSSERARAEYQKNVERRNHEWHLTQDALGKYRESDCEPWRDAADIFAFGGVVMLMVAACFLQLGINYVNEEPLLNSDAKSDAEFPTSHHAVWCFIVPSILTMLFIDIVHWRQSISNKAQVWKRLQDAMRVKADKIAELKTLHPHTFRKEALDAKDWILQIPSTGLWSKARGERYIEQLKGAAEDDEEFNEDKYYASLITFKHSLEAVVLTEDHGAGTNTLRLSDVSGLTAGMSLMVSGGGNSETMTIVTVNLDSSWRRVSRRRLASVTLDRELRNAYPQGAFIAAKQAIIGEHEAGESVLRLSDVSGLSAGMSLTVSACGNSETKTIVTVKPDSSVSLDSQLQNTYPHGAPIVAIPEASKATIEGEWRYTAGAYKLVVEDETHIQYKETNTSSEGRLQLIAGWWEGDVTIGYIRLQPIEERRIVSQFKRRPEDEWGDRIIAEKARTQESSCWSKACCWSHTPPVHFQCQGYKCILPKCFSFDWLGDPDEWIVRSSKLCLALQVAVPLVVLVLIFLAKRKNLAGSTTEANADLQRPSIALTQYKLAAETTWPAFWEPSAATWVPERNALMLVGAGRYLEAHFFDEVMRLSPLAGIDIPGAASIVDLCSARDRNRRWTVAMDEASGVYMASFSGAANPLGIWRQLGSFRYNMKRTLPLGHKTSAVAVACRAVGEDIEFWHSETKLTEAVLVGTKLRAVASMQAQPLDSSFLWRSSWLFDDDMIASWLEEEKYRSSEISIQSAEVTPFGGMLLLITAVGRSSSEEHLLQILVIIDALGHLRESLLLPLPDRGGWTAIAFRTPEMSEKAELSTLFLIAGGQTPTVASLKVDASKFHL